MNQNLLPRTPELNQTQEQHQPAFLKKNTNTILN